MPKRKDPWRKTVRIECVPNGLARLYNDFVQIAKEDGQTEAEVFFEMIWDYSVRHIGQRETERTFSFNFRLNGPREGKGSLAQLKNTLKR